MHEGQELELSVHFDDGAGFEHGVGTDDDRIRANLIPAALTELKKAMDDGVPVLGYLHWSLVDNYEWVFGYRIHFGLHTLDRKTFERKAKPSAAVLGAMARANALPAGSA